MHVHLAMMVVMRIRAMVALVTGMSIRFPGVPSVLVVAVGLRMVFMAGLTMLAALMPGLVVFLVLMLLERTAFAEGQCFQARRVDQFDAGASPAIVPIGLTRNVSSASPTQKTMSASCRAAASDGFMA